MTEAPRIAIIHDWLVRLRGGEHCLRAMLALYPGAEVLTFFHKPGATCSAIDQRVRQVSWLGKLPGVHRYYRLLLPLFPLAARSFDFSNYDAVISISHAAAKNCRVPKDTEHVCYCLTPMRYIWDQSKRYLGWSRFLFLPLIWLLRAWDRSGSSGITKFAAISNFVRARIRSYYGRGADIVYPPTNVRWLEDQPRSKPAGVSDASAFLYAGALVPYKGAELVVRACAELNLPLWVVGSGPGLAALQKLESPSIRFFGEVPDAQLAWFLANCRALVFPSREDFGLLPLECLAAGKPVIAMYAGACRETMVAHKPWDSRSSLDSASATGVFIRRSAGRQISELKKSLEFFVRHESSFLPDTCRSQALRFSPRVFYESWLEFVRTCPQLASAPHADFDRFEREFEDFRC